MKRPVNLGIASLKALLMVVVLGTVAHGSLPYLPLIGPPPLRIQTVKAPAEAGLHLAGGQATNLTAVAARDATNVTGVATSLAVSGAGGADKSLGDAFSATIFQMPTPDLMGISPQMLATYFLPVMQGTNTVPAGLVPISFMAPLPSEKPVKSSHAEYKVK
jgi:hypothetical protein